MNSEDLLKIRLSNQQLTTHTILNSADLVAHLGAVQAQDYPAAKWALGMRIPNLTDEMIEKTINDAEILRTHVLRPTWHFVHPKDIRWMLALTSPRIKQFMAHYNRKLELTDELFKKTNKLITKSLQNKNYLTRQEIKSILSQNGITTDVQRLAHIVSWAELDGLICNGPRRGKQFTYALLDERAPKTKALDREEALVELTQRYFKSHGPAQILDFSWWSGLTMTDAKKGIEMLGKKLEKHTVDEKVYFLDPSNTAIKDEKSKAFLLSIYDDYIIAYKDRDALQGGKYIEQLFSTGTVVIAVIVYDGKVIGTWKRKLKKESVEITFSFFHKPSSTVFDLFQKEIEKYGKFLNLSATLL